MAARTSWEGYLRLNLLSVPVKAYSAEEPGSSRIGFHMLHAECHSRIRYQKVCPIHGEVPKEEIVSGFEFAKGKYVVVEPQELEKLLPENDKAINIDTFIRPGELDAIYFGDRSYYLVPDGRVAQKAYAVIQRVMAEQDRHAVAQVVFSGREQVVLLRPLAGLLTMTLLNYDDQVRKPSAFEDEVPDVAVSAEELKLAETLVKASTAEKFDFTKYEDTYADKLAALLESKASGKKIVRERGHEEPAVINLMDALRRSLDSTKGGDGAKDAKRRTKPASKKVQTAKKGHRSSGRRKTG